MKELSIEEEHKIKMHHSFYLFDLFSLFPNEKRGKQKETKQLGRQKSFFLKGFSFLCKLENILQLNQQA